MRRLALSLLVLSCAAGEWRSVRADKPASRVELAAWPVSVADPALREAFSQAGFNAVARPPFKGELQLSLEGDRATLRSDGFFVDEARGNPGEVARTLAVSQRVADFVRDSGTVQQRSIPGM